HSYHCESNGLGAAIWMGWSPRGLPLMPDEFRQWDLRATYIRCSSSSVAQSPCNISSFITHANGGHVEQQPATVGPALGRKFEHVAQQLRQAWRSSLAGVLADNGAGVRFG